MKTNQKRCEGWRRYGGAFTLGPVTWKQCKENGSVMLMVKQDNEVKTMPACQTYWQECIDNKVEIIKAKPLGQNRKG